MGRCSCRQWELVVDVAHKAAVRHVTRRAIGPTGVVREFVDAITKVVGADRRNRALFQGKASQHHRKICSFVQSQDPLNRPKPAFSGHQAQDRRQRAGRRRRWRGLGGREQLERHRRRLGPQGREWLGPQAEVLEDTLRHVGLLDAGDEAHLSLTTRTLEHIDAEDPQKQRSPIQAIRRRHRRRLRRR